MKTCRGKRGLAPLISNFCIRSRWTVSFTLRPLYPRNPSHRRLGGPKPHLDSLEKRKNDKITISTQRRGKCTIQSHQLRVKHNCLFVRKHMLAFSLFC